MSEKDDFLYPYSSYGGPVRPRELLFDANLQEFAHKVGMIGALENGGKLTPAEAYQQIKGLWKQLKRSKKALLDPPAQDDSSPQS